MSEDGHVDIGITHGETEELCERNQVGLLVQYLAPNSGVDPGRPAENNRCVFLAPCRGA